MSSLSDRFTRALLATAAFSAFAVGAPLVAVAERVANSGFVLDVDAPAARSGQSAVARIQVTPAAGYHINKEYPSTLVLDSVPAGVTINKLQQTSKDAAKWEEQGGEFDVAYTAERPGKKILTGELKLAMCSSNSCNPKKSRIRFEIDVQ